ncbi:MAG: hypothetical protein ACXWT3_15150 [Methylococcaceae bacterium]
MLKPAVNFYAILAWLLASFFCPITATANNGLEGFPPIILWAWERPEDLRFLDNQKFGVAFLAQTLQLQGDELVFAPRRQPLKVSPATRLIAVTRIETDAKSLPPPTLSIAQSDEIVRLVLKTLTKKNVSAIQIDLTLKCPNVIFTATC